LTKSATAGYTSSSFCTKPGIGGIYPIFKHTSYHCSQGQSDDECVITVEMVSAVKGISEVLCSPYFCASVPQSWHCSVMEHWNTSHSV